MKKKHNYAFVSFLLAILLGFLTVGCSSGGGSSSSSGVSYGSTTTTTTGKYSQNGVYCTPAAVYSSASPTSIEIKGSSFGNVKGTVSLYSDGQLIENLSVTSWGNSSILVSVNPKGRPIGSYYMVATPPGASAITTENFEIITDGAPLIKDVIFTEYPTAGITVPSLIFSGTNFWQGSTPPGNITFYIQIGQNTPIQLQRASTSGDDSNSVYNTSKNLSVTLSGSKIYFFAVSGTKQSNIITVPVASEVIGKIYAVFVGINDYQSHNKLNYALGDSQAIQSALTYGTANNMWLGADIRAVNNKEATKANITSNLNDVASKIGSNDTFVMYYSGHGAALGSTGGSPDSGVTLSSETYIIPVDAGSQSTSAFSSEELRVILAKMPAGTKKILMFDACFSGGFSGKSSNASSNLIPKIAYLEDSGDSEIKGLGFKSIGTSIQNVFFSTSSRYNELSYEDPNKSHGAYTYYLLQGLGANGNALGSAATSGVIRIQELHNYLAPLTIEATKPAQNQGLSEQNPQLYTSTSGANCTVKGNVR